MGNFLDGIFDRTSQLLSKGLDLTWRRNQAISSNIANAETPQYRAVDLHFGDELQKAIGTDQTILARTDQKHLDLGKTGDSHLVADYSGITKPDGNNVDIDVQMGRLAYNSSRYSAYSNYLGKKLQMLKRAINESR